MADDRLVVAVDEVAKRVAHDLLRGAILRGEVEDMWERYDEVGEHDWQAVEGRVLRLATEVNPSNETIEAAYEFLSERAGDE